MSQQHFAAATAPIPGSKPSPTSVPNSVPERSPAATLGAIFLAVFFLSTGSALQSTAVVLRAGIEGFGDFLVGITMASYYLGFLVGCIVSPLVLSQGGYGRTFAGFASIASAGALAHLLIINPTAWILLRFVHGICIASMLVVVEQWLTKSAPRKSGATILALYSVMHIAAMGLGQPLLGVFGSGGFRLFVIVSIVTSLSMLPLTLIRGNGVLNIPIHAMRLRQVVHASPVPSTGLLAAGFLTAAIWSLGPSYSRDIGLGDMETGLFMAGIALGAVIALGGLTAFRNQWRARTLIAITTAIGTITGLILLPGPSFDFSWYFALALLSGASIMPVYSLSIAQALDQIGPDKLLSTAGAFVVIYSVGAILGPILSSLAMAAFGPGGLFGTVILVQASIFLVVIRGSVQIPGPGARKIGRFQPYPRTTQTVFSLLKAKADAPIEDRQEEEPEDQGSENAPKESPDPDPRPEPGSGLPYGGHLHTDFLPGNRLRA